MLENLLTNLKRLEKTEIQIYAEGKYPTKQRTPVQNVAKWQNDGTETISPSHFVERSAREQRYWKQYIFREVLAFLYGDTIALKRAAQIVAGDIMAKVDRIDTRRLSHSFTHRIIQDGREIQ